MDIVRWDPFSMLARLDEEFDEIMKRTWGRATAPSAGFVPAIDMVTDGGDVVIVFDLPGVDVDKDVDIEVVEGRLVVSGTRQDPLEERSESARVLVQELRTGSFRREFLLPEGVGADAVEAAYDRGLLRVRVRNITKPPVPPKKVPIQSGTSTERKTIQGKVEPGD